MCSLIEGFLHLLLSLPASLPLYLIHHTNDGKILLKTYCV